MAVSKEEVAWAAGLFEGEGYVGFDNNQKPRYVRIGVLSTDYDVLVELQRVIGFGHLNGPYPSGHYNNLVGKKPVWTWTITRKDHAKEVLQLFLPWMGKRRSQKILDALRVIEARFTRHCKYCGKLLGLDFLPKQRYCSNSHFKLYWKKKNAQYYQENKEEFARKYQESKIK